jgi:hypothetical protein
MPLGDKLSHANLVELSAVWLRKKHPVVVTEVACCGGEEADAIGFNGILSTIIECKALRSDFLSDNKKLWRQRAEIGLGNYRYYCCPRGLISIHELPENWGLLEVVGGQVFTAHKAKMFSDKASEAPILISVIRRIGKNHPVGVSIRCYTHTTKNRATVSIETDNDDEKTSGFHSPNTSIARNKCHSNLRGPS